MVIEIDFIWKERVSEVQVHDELILLFIFIIYFRIWFLIKFRTQPIQGLISGFIKTFVQSYFKKVNRNIVRILEKKIEYESSNAHKCWFRTNLFFWRIWRGSGFFFGWDPVPNTRSAWNRYREFLLYFLVKEFILKR